MKTPISLIVAAALIVPAAASAQRITTPGTFDRHARNLAQTEEVAPAERRDDRMATTERSPRADRVPAAKAGRVNTAAPAARVGASS